MDLEEIRENIRENLLGLIVNEPIYFSGKVCFDADINTIRRLNSTFDDEIDSLIKRVHEYSTENDAEISLLIPRENEEVFDFYKWTRLSYGASRLDPSEVQGTLRKPLKYGSLIMSLDGFSRIGEIMDHSIMKGFDIDYFEGGIAFESDPIEFIKADIERSVQGVQIDIDRPRQQNSD